MNRLHKGFTIVEIIMVIAVIAILTAIVVISFGSWRHHAADSSVQNDLLHGTSGLKLYQGFKNDYPPNLGGIDFSSSNSVVLKLSTNADQVRVYSGLTNAQNAQLFLNVCNALMPIQSGGTTYSTACTFAGNNIHIKGQHSSNVVWHGPSIDQSDVALTCGSACDAAIQTIFADFSAQGGVFPIFVPSGNVPLPPYTLVGDGPATRFCLEGVSALYDDVIYHTTSEDTSMLTGPCPVDPELHYP